MTRIPSLPLAMLAGEMLGSVRRAAIDFIYDRIDAWHDAATALSLHEWLGWTRAEYAAWRRGEPAD